MLPIFSCSGFYSEFLKQRRWPLKTSVRTPLYKHTVMLNLCISLFYFSLPASDDQQFVAGVIHCLWLTDAFQDNIKL